MTFTTLLANLLVTGCALLLVRRGPTRRLKLLTLVVGLASFSQTAANLHRYGYWNPGPRTAEIHELLVAALALCAIYLLGQEIYDRNLTDKRLRLAEFDLARPEPPKPESEVGATVSAP